MTPQQVIQNFMGKLVDHGQSYSASIGTAMLNSAVQSSSEFSDAQAVIDSMKADQIKAEKQAVKEILGEEKLLSAVDATLLSELAKNNSAVTTNSTTLLRNDTTVKEYILQRKAEIFLEEYCGIQLNNKFCFYTSNGARVIARSSATGNVDTGAITGSDANITLKAGDVLGDATLTAENLKVLKTKYDSAASLSSDGNTIVIGTGVEKTDRSIVPEIGNKYTATTAQAQNIKTGSNDWLVVATGGNDTILTGGADSISAGAGNDKITVGADYATILTGAGSDNVEISAEVKNITLGDLNSSDILKISGTFEVGSAKIEDTLLVITDKTGTRKIRLGDFDTAKNAKINSTTIGAWLTNSGIDLNNLQVTTSTNVFDTLGAEEIGVVEGGEEQIAIDPDYTPTPIQKTRSVEETQDLPQRSSSSTGVINVNLDNVTLTGGDLNLDGSKVGEISNEFPNVNSFTKNGLTINLVGTTSNTDGYPSNFTSKTFDQLTEDEKTIVAGLFKWWGKECLQLNEESYDISFKSSTAQVKEIGLYFYDGNGSSNTLATVWNWSTNSGQNTTKLMLNVNMDYYKGIAADNFDGESSKSSAGLLDRTLSHEFTHALMATNLHYFNSLPKFIKEGMAELTHGIDDFRPSNIFKIAYDADWLDASLDLSNTGTGSQSIGDGYSGGFMFLRYLAKQGALQAIADDIEVAEPSNPLLITLTEGNDSYSNSLAGATIQALGGNDTIYNPYVNVSINAGDGNDSIVSKTTSYNTVRGGKGNDTISYYWYNSILDGGADSDKISVNGTNNTIIGGDGDDSIYNASYQTSIIAGSGNDYVHNYGNPATIDGGTGNDTIFNWGNSGTGTSINGGSGNDSIVNGGSQDGIGYSVSNNLSISGGSGNDTIVNNGGSNMLFSYTSGDGNDSVVGFNTTSTLQIGNGTTDTYSKSTVGSNVLVSVGGGVITLQGAASLSTLNIAGTEVDTTPAGVNIRNYTNSTLITSGAGNDTIYNSGEKVKIISGTGDDSIYNTNESVSIDAGAGNDTIHNNWTGWGPDGDYVTINAGDGEDIVQDGGAFNFINLGAGNDSIYSWNNYNTIDAGAGNDTINSRNGWSSLSGGAGNDVFILTQSVHDREGTKVNGGVGNDSIYSESYAGHIYQYASGDGNDIIYGFNGNDTLQITNGKYSTAVSGNDFVFKVGSNSITLKDIAADKYARVKLMDASGNVSIYNDWSIMSGTAGDDYLKNFAYNVTVDGLDGNDTIENYGINVSVIGGAGNDSIHSDGYSSGSTVDAGSGDDIIYQRGGSSKVYGGTGNDSISNRNNYNTVDGGAGDDTIESWNSDRTTLSGGTGNDIISISGDYHYSQKNLILYESGDGNDIIYGFNATSTLSVSGGYKSTTQSGKDIIVTVGDGNITLVGAANLSTVNIVGEAPVLKIIDGQAIYGTTDEVFFTIYGISSAAKLTDFALSGTTVTIGRSALGEDEVFLEGEGYTLQLGKSVPQSPTITNGGWSSFVNGKATYTASGYSAYYTLEDNTVTYTPAEGGEQFELTGIKSIAATAVKVDDEDKVVTLFKAALGTDTITLKGDDYSLALDESIIQDPGVSERKFTALANGTATYKIFGDRAYYTLDGNEVFYTGATDDKTFTISGLANNLTLKNGAIAGVSALVNEEDKTVKFTLAAATLKDSDVTLNGTGATLELGSDVSTTAQNIPEAWSEVAGGTASFSTNGKTKYYTLANGKVTYHAPIAGDLQIKLSGLSTTAQTVDGKIDGLTVSGKSLTIGVAAVGKNVALQYNNGFDVNLASDVKNISFTGTSGVDSITNYASKVSINSELGDDFIQSGGDHVSIYAGVGNDSILNVGWNATLDAGAGNNSIISNGWNVVMIGNAGKDTIDSRGSYVTISSGAGDDEICIKYGFASIDGGADNDFITDKGESNVTINTAQGNDTIQLGASVKSFTAEGFSAGDVIRLYSSATKLETISGGIKAGNVSISGVEGIATVNNSWSTSTNSVAYNQSTVAGAKLSGKTITYDTTSGTENLFTISGIKSTMGVSLSGKEITLNNAALNGITGTVSISGGDYKLKLASDVDTIAEDNTSWTTLTGGNVAYLEGGKGSYYSLSSDGKSVTYNAAVAGTNKVEFGGVKGTPTISGKTVSLTANNFNGNVSVASNAGNYQFALSGKFGGKKFTGTAKADKISNSGSNISIDGGAGNDTFINSGANVTLTGGKGNDVFAYSKGNFKITDYTASADKISLDIAGVQDVVLNNKDVTLKLGQSDAVTIVGGKDKKITVAKSKTAQYIFGDHVILNSGKTSASLTSAATKFDATSYSAMVTVDGAKTNSAAKIVGNAKANKIYAGAKGSTLNGGKGNDTLFGGAGVDVFVYANKTGNDVIQNFTSGKDKISLTGGASVAGFSVNTSGDAVLKIGSNNLTIKKADNEDISTNGKKITIIDAAGNETTKTYFTNRTVSGKGVTLNAEYSDSFTASSAIVSVDATQNENSLVINGNSKNNILSGGTGNDKLLGGAGNDTLSGGEGNDTLTGGKGNDLFVYTSGKDVIADYAVGDKISISAAISKSTLKGSDAVFGIGSGTLTVKKGKGKELVFVDAKGAARTIIGGAQLINNSTAAKTTLASSVAVADASERTKAITLTGNASANTILGGSGSDILYGGKGNDSLVGGKGNDKLYGQAGNDSLWGGAGNDSLYGSSGSDTFIYKPNEGTDKIFDYQSGDILQIFKADGTAGGSFKSSKFSGGALTLTINGGGTVIFDGVAKGDKFNINGKTYTISGSKLK